MYYDREFKYPKANGVKKINGSWDSNIRGEYIFERCREWIEKYFGNDNDIKFGVGEFNIKNSASNMVHALSYASHIGEGCRFGMEYFTPWTWYPSMWEVVHLYSSYAKGISVRAVSSDSALVSAYTSKNTANDSVTIVLVNRAKEEKIVDLDILHTNFPNKQYNTHTLANLPNGDTLTFVSHTDNALKSGLVEINNNHIALSIPPYSITAIELGDGVTNVNEIANGKDNDVIIYPNPAKGILNISSESGICEVDMFNLTGMKVFSINGEGKRNLTLSTSDLTAGSYIVKIISVNGINVKKISILK